MLGRMLRTVVIIFALIGCAPSAISPPESPATAPIAAATPTGSESPMIFKADSGEEIEAFAGKFSVPENWSASNSREITLHYVRFAALGAHPGSPIVYLAGGPGGSGIQTARHERFPLFMAMRQFGDVIAFDQRGTGEGNTLPVCQSAQQENDAQTYTDAEFAEMHRAAARECLTFWRNAGVDILGYTTAQSARDLDALRKHLGADKVTLWGISYGTHLALAALKTMEDRIDRVVLASVEGLDQTVKSPAQTDAYFARLQAAIDAYPALKPGLPDIVGLMRRVHAKLDKAPLVLELPSAKGIVTYTVERRDAQQFASASIADPESALRLLYLYTALDQGITTPLQGLLQPSPPISLGAMPLAMDVASGITRERLVRIEEETKTALLGGYLNFPMPQLDRLLPELDLGDTFRAGPTSAVPTLVLSGTLDGRTYVEEQREAVAGLSNARIVLVRHAGHNLFMTSPEVTARIESFMRGETVSTDDIVVELAVPSL